MCLFCSEAPVGCEQNKPKGPLLDRIRGKPNSELRKLFSTVYLLKLPSTIVVSIWSLEPLYQKYPEFLLKGRFLGTLPKPSKSESLEMGPGELGISIFNKISFAPSPQAIAVFSEESVQL